MSGRNPTLYCTVTTLITVRYTRIEAKDTMNMNTNQFSYIRSGIGCVSIHHVISHQANLTAYTKKEK